MTSVCHKQFFLFHLSTPGISQISSARNAEAALGTIQPEVVIPDKPVQNNSHHIRAFLPKDTKAGNKCTPYWHQPPSKYSHHRAGRQLPLFPASSKKEVDVIALQIYGEILERSIIPVIINIGKNSFTMGSIAWSHENCSGISFLSHPGS